MSDIAIQQLLSQMRTMAAEFETAKAPTGNTAAQGGGFGALLERAIESVSTQQAESTRLAAALEAGAPGVDVAQVMIEMQRASLSFKAMTEVRNRLVNAYQEIMNMPV